MGEDKYKIEEVNYGIVEIVTLEKILQARRRKVNIRLREIQEGQEASARFYHNRRYVG